MMRLPMNMEIYRRALHGQLGDRCNGCLLIPARRLKIIFTNDGGWEHVSVSAPDRCPTWDELEWVKRRLWESADTVMQLHVPPAEHVNCHPYCLHLWRPMAEPIPRPPPAMVGGC